MAVGEVFLMLPDAVAAPDPRMLAWSAIDSMRLQGVRIGMAPPAGSQALVNAPVLLWAESPDALTWGPAVASASAGTVTVTATARASAVAWSMGDGSVVRCGQGTAYTDGTDPAASDCSHTFRGPGSRQVTATTSWDVQWVSSTGVTGSEALTTSSTTSVEVREARALIIGRE